ncbi:MAG: hypothetical protein WDN26_21915 [Chitinophagaceae bacterium]
MFNRILTTICLLLIFTATKAQDTVDAYVEKEFVIIKSAPKYEDALQTAKLAATKLQLKLDLRELKKNTATGLTWSKQTCEDEWGEFPCYVARGRYDDGNYVSIEYSNAYTGFREGYYIVIVAGGERGSKEVKSALTNAKKIYKDAYSKRTKVYVGCMH